MSQYDLTFFMGGGRRRIKVYKNKEVTVGGNSVQVLIVPRHKDLCL